jgi:hypothetical protein
MTYFVDLIQNYRIEDQFLDCQVQYRNFYRSEEITYLISRNGESSVSKLHVNFSHRYLLHAAPVVCKNNIFVKILQKCNESESIEWLD